MSVALPAGTFTILISDDGLQAELRLQPHPDGTPLDAVAVFDALAQAGVITGIDSPAVLAACGSTEALQVTVAQAIPARAGSDTHFEVLIAETRDRAPRISEDGLVDFRELGAIPLVSAGASLMRRIPPGRGEDGRSVRGEVIPAPAGRDLAFDQPLLGAKVAAGDPDLLVACVNGQPVRQGNAVMIEQVLQVARVDVASGNLVFDGTVEVAGDVLPGMKVKATGDVVVKGAVDGGEVEAQGDVQVHGGIIAQARIRAGGSVSARFVESASLYAGVSIAVEDTAMQSELQAMNSIRVGTKSAQRGRLSGGSAKAMMLIEAPWLGAEAGAITRIELGVNPELDKKYQDVLQRIEQQKSGEAKLQLLIKHLSTHGDKDGMLLRAKASWQHSVQTWSRLLPERDALDEQRALVASARVVVGSGVAGGVDLLFGSRSVKLRQTFAPGEFALDAERIVFRGKARAL
jgi:uncharacterized protein (DUF342 family)